jgi:hypothetical protein
MDRKYLEELIKNIQGLVKCPNCGASYKTNMISILGGADHTFLVHLECSLCGSPTLATVMFRQQKSADLPDKDFYEREIKKSNFGNKNFNREIYKFGFGDLPVRGLETPFNQTRGKKINTDDVLNMHRFLKDFNGNFESILGE